MVPVEDDDGVNARRRSAATTALVAAGAVVLAVTLITGLTGTSGPEPVASVDALVDDGADDGPTDDGLADDGLAEDGLADDGDADGGDAAADGDAGSALMSADDGVAGEDTPVSRGGTNPFAGRRLFTWPHSALDDVAAWGLDDPEDVAVVERVLEVPVARWFGSWAPDPFEAVDRYVTAADEAGELPVILAFNVPLMDCSSYDGGGAPSDDAYRSWVERMAAGIGERDAVVVLEPSGLGRLGCLDPEQQSTIVGLLSEAVDVLGAQPGTSVYIDAGHPEWLPLEVLVPRLVLAGVDRARGVSINIANHVATDEAIAYAEAIHSATGAQAIIDTSRNGAGHDGEACNAPGRAIGALPTDETGSEVVDAFFWGKLPGESDGDCGDGGEPAGTFLPERALELARRAGW